MVKTRRNNNIKRHRRKRRTPTLKGGFTQLPPYPPGGPYIPGDINGLDGGKYYSLSPDIHAPNGAIINTSVANSNAKLLNGGAYKKRGRRTRRKHKGKKHTRSGTRRHTRRNNKVKKHKGRAHRGGGFIPRDLVNLYRTAGNGVKSLYAQATGQHSNPSNNPNPMYQPRMTREHRLNASSPNVSDIFDRANHKASNAGM